MTQPRAENVGWVAREAALLKQINVLKSTVGSLMADTLDGQQLWSEANFEEATDG